MKNIIIVFIIVLSLFGFILGVCINKAEKASERYNSAYANILNEHQPTNQEWYNILDSDCIYIDKDYVDCPTKTNFLYNLEAGQIKEAIKLYKESKAEGIKHDKIIDSLYNHFNK